ncbi:MAG: YdcF family protein [Lachnospiraceae bacterium]|nr:YdcF family protein [Lachnospiraceae bacterium]
MNIFRIILSIVGFIGVVWFSLPIFSNKILNIGNATGIILFAMLLIYCCFMKYINSFILSIWSKNIGKTACCIVGFAILICFTFAIIETCFMVHAAGKTPQNGSTLIVLGCKVNGEQPTLMLRERLDAAYEFLIANEDSLCILSGGKGNGEDISEAECMYKYLIDKGIRSSRLYIEDKSTSTRENLAFSYKIIEKYDLPKNIAIATNEFHIYRAGIIAEELGLEYTSVSASTAWWLLPTYYVRELYGILYQWFL